MHSTALHFHTQYSSVIGELRCWYGLLECLLHWSQFQGKVAIIVRTETHTHSHTLVIRINYTVRFPKQAKTPNWGSTVRVAFGCNITRSRRELATNLVSVARRWNKNQCKSHVTIHPLKLPCLQITTKKKKLTQCLHPAAAIGRSSARSSIETLARTGNSSQHGPAVWSSRRGWVCCALPASDWDVQISSLCEGVDRHRQKSVSIRLTTENYARVRQLTLTLEVADPAGCSNPTPSLCLSQCHRPVKKIEKQAIIKLHFIRFGSRNIVLVRAVRVPPMLSAPAQRYAILINSQLISKIIANIGCNRNVIPFVRLKGACVSPACARDCVAGQNESWRNNYNTIYICRYKTTDSTEQLESMSIHPCCVANNTLLSLHIPDRLE